MTLHVSAHKGPANYPFKTWWRATVERTMGQDIDEVPESRVIVSHRYTV